NNPEYQVACYITSVSMIFNKVKSNIIKSEYPLDWFNNWIEKHEKRNDNDEELDLSFEVDYDLSSSMKQLGGLARNLFNGYKDFNLMDCIGVLDDKHLPVVKSAIDIRLGILLGR